MEKIKVQICKESDVTFPKYMTHGSSGMDLYAYIENEIELKPFERKLIATGIFVAIPYGYEIQIRPRSGLAFKHGITVLNTPGTIDSDYRGEIKIILANLSHDTYIIKPQDRIAQMVLQKVLKMEFEEVKNLCETERKDGGFGHTG